MATKATEKPSLKEIKADLSPESASRIKRFTELLARQREIDSGTKLERVAFWPKQLEFLSLKAAVRVMFGGNRVGKTRTAGAEVAIHLTGRYPKDWKGKRFRGPIRAWCSGITTETTRETVQRELLGDVEHAFGTGWIPKDEIEGKPKMRQGVPGSVDHMYVRHYDENGVYDGLSYLGFKSNDMGREKFMGTDIHVVWLDEEHDMEVFSEARVRNMNVRGITIMTFTPLKGMSELCQWVLKSEDPSVKWVFMGWKDALHLSTDQIEELMKSIPAHELEARMNGTPVVSEGLIYPFPVSSYMVEDLDRIPTYFRRVIGMDVGFSTVMAAGVLLVDDYTGTYYWTQEAYMEKQTPEMHAARLRPYGPYYIACDPNVNRKESDGKAILEKYKKAGLTNIHNANNNVIAGLTEVQSLFAAGRLKITRSCVKTLEEIRFYQMGKDGKPVKKNDHCMDALRYAVMSAGDALTPLRAHGFVRPTGSNWKPGDPVAGY